jgi:CubicO group peptidase (beta-lactamase class C family)
MAIQAFDPRYDARKVKAPARQAPTKDRIDGPLAEARTRLHPSWIEFQMRMPQQPGCIVAIAHRSAIVLERAFGCANLATGATLTPRHRFRVASRSKSFTAAGTLKLREQSKLKLDDQAGQFVADLHAGLLRSEDGEH